MAHINTGRNYGENVRQRSTRESANGEAVREEKSYTPEQLQAVKNILRCKDYYRILGVSRDATEADIIEQYRSLALQFHPDKNGAPGAAEAFKVISNARDVLLDADKRSRYDQYGDENAQPLANGAHHDYRRDRRRAHGQERIREDCWPSLFWFIGIVIGILAVGTLMAPFIWKDPAYALQKKESYYIERATAGKGIIFFVQDDFIDKYGGELETIERKVEEEAIRKLQTWCLDEKKKREEVRARARLLRDQSLLDRANAMPLKSCDTLETIAQRG